MMKPASIILLPDDLTDPIGILRVGEDSDLTLLAASLSSMRTGEDGFASAPVRRYELAHYPDADPADLMARRVVIQDAQQINSYAAPGWVRREVGLHPERRDIASWFRAARLRPNAPWQAHLGIALRDALRNYTESPAALLVMPDRAYLAASADDQTALPTGVLSALTAPVRALDHTAIPTGEELPALRLGDAGIVARRRGVVTRGQAVIAEALMNGHDATPIPTSENIIARWCAAVDDDHSARLRQTGDTEWAAPVAILDDHRDSRATLILATVNISLAATSPDIWFIYHEVIEIAANRPMDLDLKARLRAGSEPLDTNRAALIAAIQEQALPVLEISTTRDGYFDNRLLSDLLPDPVPLLRAHPSFEFQSAVLAYLQFLDPEAHRQSASATATGPVTASTGGESDHAGGGPDVQEPEPNALPPISGTAPGTDPFVGGTDETAVDGDADGSAGAALLSPSQVSANAPAGQGTEQPAVADDSDDSGEDDDSGDGGARGGSGSVSGAMDLRNDPPAHVVTAVQSAMIGGEADIAGTDDDIPFTGLDVRLTGSPQDESGGASDQTDGETETLDAHGSPDIAITADPAGWLDRLYAEMTDTDNKIVRHIRQRVAAARAEKGSAAGAPDVPSDETLAAHATFISREMHKAAQVVATSTRLNTTKAYGLFKPLISEGEPWLRLLAALNAADVVQSERPGNPYFRLGGDQLGRVASTCHKQAKLAGVEISYPSEARPRNSLTGGGHA
jgi:hypothetical protein